jgi:hypothetical protein
LTKLAQNVDNSTTSRDSADLRGVGAPIELTQRQVRDGREAIRDWLGSGRDSLTVTNSSLDRVLREVLHSLFRREVILGISSPA